MFSDFREAKVSVKARAGTHRAYTTLGFGFQIKEYGRCVYGESVWWKGVGPWTWLPSGESDPLG